MNINCSSNKVLRLNNNLNKKNKDKLKKMINKCKQMS